MFRCVNLTMEKSIIPLLLLCTCSVKKPNYTWAETILSAQLADTWWNCAYDKYIAPLAHCVLFQIILRCLRNTFLRFTKHLNRVSVIFLITWRTHYRLLLCIFICFCSVSEIHYWWFSLSPHLSFHKRLFLVLYCAWKGTIRVYLSRNTTLCEGVILINELY